MITGRQIRAARALLDISQDDLAIAAGLTKQGISKIEDGSVQPREGTITDITRVFRDKGVEFTENQGVRLKPAGVEVYEGVDRYDEFYDFLYEHLKKNGGDVCLSVLQERVLSKYRKDPSLHRRRMKELFDRGAITFRILATESDFSSSYATYRWQLPQSAAPTSFYAFGDCLALISFAHVTPPYVVVIQSSAITEAYRSAFDIAWAQAKETPYNKDEGI